MRRITSVLAVASVATVALAGCSAAAPEADGPVELTLWTGFTGGDRGAYEDLITAFNDTHDDIQVSMEVQPWDTIAQKLPSAWATGQGPDLATPSFDPNVVAKYVETNSLLKLDDVGDVSLLAPAAIDAFTVDGALYAVPANVATLQLYYNKTMFAEAGIDQPPATVEDFKTDAVALTDGGTVGLSLADHETIQMWPILQWLEGGDIVDSDGCSVLDSPENIAGLQSWVDVVDAGAAPVGLTGAEADSLFSAGKAAMQLNGPWAAAGYAEAGIDFGVAPVPVGVDGPVTLSSTVPMSAAAKTAHPAEAQEFLEWWTGQDAQRQFALASGFPPVRTDLADDPELASNEIVAAFAEALPSARLYLVGVDGATQVDSEAYVPFIGEITRGGDVADAAAAATAKINAITGCEDK
ncbi:multiple sugar transport system substrate-binding protein [Microbacterium endophyticum]|uniref:Multiple sugar transport system substrate-binding protein n=1 Tax=Microbacterium endophyticum TaxID=1526412 RepID=A0A7W4V3X0_9MICO|nr:ABC transporter substrate-binding protein [Microbacterium endophyticum]MBB2976411.1 multiple sugar transport system substrate-binding protein [Microbacterium endophyticum]NIK35857.1 multiple sugar transport system substrate-binding protein [Microbacterium endophyticum]